MPGKERMRYYPAVGPAIPLKQVGRSRVTHPFAGDGLLRPLDLHVLSTPPAFVLSQDQTLQEKNSMLIALRTAVALFATARPNHLDMIRSELSPKP